MKTIHWVLIGFGVVGLGLGAYFMFRKPKGTNDTTKKDDRILVGGGAKPTNDGNTSIGGGGSYKIDNSTGKPVAGA
jgi:hypothetical protein